MTGVQGHERAHTHTHRAGDSFYYMVRRRGGQRKSIESKYADVGKTNSWCGQSYRLESYNQIMNI